MGRQRLSAPASESLCSCLQGFKDARALHQKAHAVPQTRAEAQRALPTGRGDGGRGRGRGGARALQRATLLDGVLLCSVAGASWVGLGWVFDWLYMHILELAACARHPVSLAPQVSKSHPA